MGRSPTLLLMTALCALTLVAHPARGADTSPLDAGRPAFPALTGPVVDDAHLLPPQTRSLLAEKLAQYARRTSTQVVVVTLASLHGYPIEYYGYQLGRHWGIGQKGKNNGALLIVDAGEKQVRIEVGYGLEGTLTDAASFEIIHNIIVPKFKQGDYAGGIVAGTDAILTVLGDQAAAAHRAQVREHSGTGMLMLLIVLFALWPLIATLVLRGRGGRLSQGGAGGSWWLWWALGLLSGMGGGGGGFSGGGGFGGGFSGGGGSFGGGGASGSW
ncbi:MAG: TPM domain-containing protein [Gammaproteobacteria bacterium]|nr:TPM domain-containing protein [Gammaproteobacteria bacterium]